MVKNTHTRARTRGGGSSVPLDGHLLAPVVAGMENGRYGCSITKMMECVGVGVCHRHMDMDGFTADISYLRKMLTAVDRKLHEMRLVER